MRHSTHRPPAHLSLPTGRGGASAIKAPPRVRQTVRTATPQEQRHRHNAPRKTKTPQKKPNSNVMQININGIQNATPQSTAAPISTAAPTPHPSVARARRRADWCACRDAAGGPLWQTNGAHDPLCAAWRVARLVSAWQGVQRWHAHARRRAPPPRSAPRHKAKHKHERCVRAAHARVPRPAQCTASNWQLHGEPPLLITKSTPRPRNDNPPPPR